MTQNRGFVQIARGGITLSNSHDAGFGKFFNPARLRLRQPNEDDMTNSTDKLCETAASGNSSTGGSMVKADKLDR